MIQLHIHSYYTFLQGTISIDKIIEYAKKYNLKSIALTDTNCMCGLIEFAKKCKVEKIKPILGALINDPVFQNEYAVFLAKNNEGYAELCKIITMRKLREDFSLYEIINKKSENLFVITSSIDLLKKITFSKNLYVELISTKRHKRKSKELYEFAQYKNLKIVATHPAYFVDKDDYSTHKIVTSIRLNKTFENLTDTNIIDEEYYLIDPEVFEKRWKIFYSAIHASEDIAEKCNVNLELNKYKFPHIKVPTNESAYTYLWKESFQGLHKRYDPVTEVAINRLEKELKVIDDMNLSDYFLMVLSIVKEAKRRGMLFIGRGSAANSLTAYCLGLTQVDPIRYNLYFERFLNKSRRNLPDIDIDFSWKERDEIIKYVFEHYGYEYVAMISTTITFKARSAFREVAKTFGITNEEISQYSKFIPWTNAKNLLKISELFPESCKVNFNIEPWKSIINIAVKIADFPRHLSIHPSGIIITPKPVTNYVALEYAKNKGLGLIITQPDMYSIEDMGLIKIDLLSQRSLGVLRDTLTNIRKREEN